MSLRNKANDSWLLNIYYEIFFFIALRGKEDRKQKYFKVIMLKKLVMSVILICFVATAWATSVQSIHIKKEGVTYKINMIYPQGFSSKSIDKKIKKTMYDMQKEFNDLGEIDDQWIKSGIKDFLHVTYEIKSNNPRVLSLLFNIQTYGRGAAHPNDHIETINFIDGKEVILKDLFAPKSHFLKKIADFCREDLLKLGSPSDEEWFESGIKPKLSNYTKWYFSKRGLVIIFDSEQIAAGISGPQFVTIPHAILKTWPFTNMTMLAIYDCEASKSCSNTN